MANISISHAHSWFYCLTRRLLFAVSSFSLYNGLTSDSLFSQNISCQRLPAVLFLRRDCVPSNAKRLIFPFRHIFFPKYLSNVQGDWANNIRMYSPKAWLVAQHPDTFIQHYRWGDQYQDHCYLKLSLYIAFRSSSRRLSLSFAVS